MGSATSTVRRGYNQDIGVRISRLVIDWRWVMVGK